MIEKLVAMLFLNLSKHNGKYELGKTLRDGGLIKIKISRNVENNTTVAIKKIDKVLNHRKDMIEKIKRQISTMKLVNHPNVLQLLDVMANETKIYLMIKHVPSGKLLNKIKMGKK